MQCPDVQLAAFVFGASNQALTFTPSQCTLQGTNCSVFDPASNLMIMCSAGHCVFGPPLPPQGSAPIECAVVDIPCAQYGLTWACSPKAFDAGLR